LNQRYCIGWYKAELRMVGPRKNGNAEMLKATVFAEKNLANVPVSVENSKDDALYPGSDGNEHTEMHSNKIFLLGHEIEEPSGYKLMFEKAGYVLIHVDFEPLLWNSLKEPEVAFKGFPVDINDLGNDSLISLFRCSIERTPFYKALRLLFRDCLGKRLLGYESRTDIGKIPAYVFKFDENIVLAGHFIDKIRPKKGETPAYRAIWFNEEMEIHIARFKNDLNDSMYAKQKAFFDTISLLKAGVNIFGGAVYGNTCGDTGSVSLARNQVLLLPSPCCFYPITSGKKVYMGTALFTTAGFQEWRREDHGLEMCYSPAMFKLTKGWNKIKHDSDIKKCREAMKAAAQVSEINLRSWTGFEHRNVRISIYPAKKVLERSCGTLRTPEKIRDSPEEPMSTKEAEPKEGDKNVEVPKTNEDGNGHDEADLETEKMSTEEKRIGETDDREKKECIKESTEEGTKNSKEINNADDRLKKKRKEMPTKMDVEKAKGSSENKNIEQEKKRMKVSADKVNE